MNHLHVYDKACKDCLKDPSTADNSTQFYIKKEHYEFPNITNFIVPSSDVYSTGMQLAKRPLYMYMVLTAFSFHVDKLQSKNMLDVNLSCIKAIQQICIASHSS